MRLFVAIEVDDEARAAIDRERERLISAMGAVARELRWVRTEHMHLTLVFLGAVDESGAAAFIAALSRDFDQPAYDMTVGGLGIFPPRGAPRTLWVGVAAGGEQTIALQREVAGRVPEPIRPRLERNARAFTPHLTLARWREGHASRRWLSAQPASPLAVVRVEGVTLFESRLSAGGPTYTALARSRLTCPRA